MIIASIADKNAFRIVHSFPSIPRRIVGCSFAFGPIIKAGANDCGVIVTNNVRYRKRSPRKLGDCRSATMVMIIDAERIGFARFQRAYGGYGSRRVILPIVDDQFAVQEDANAIVGTRSKSMWTRVGGTDHPSPTN